MGPGRLAILMTVGRCRSDGSYGATATTHHVDDEVDAQRDHCHTGDQQPCHACNPQNLPAFFVRDTTKVVTEIA